MGEKTWGAVGSHCLVAWGRAALAPCAQGSPIPTSPCHRELAHDCLGWDAEAFPRKAAGTLTFPFLLSKFPRGWGRAEGRGLACLLPGCSGVATTGFLFVPC